MERKDDFPRRRLDVFEILEELLRHWWSILLVAVASALLANVWAYRSYQPAYTTSASFAVTRSGAATNIYQDITAAKELAEQFTTVLNSNLLKKRVAEDLGLDAFHAQSTVSIVPETNLVVLRVTAPSAQESFQVLDSILRNYNTVSDYVIENVILQVLQPAQIPTSPSNSVGSRGAMVKGGLAGGAAVCAVILLLTSLRDTVKNRRDMEEKIDAKCLGVICHEKKEDLTKKGLKRKSSRAVSMLVENPLRSFRFVSANHMLADSVARVMEHRGVKILLLTSVLENEGKSTVAANLALSLAQEGKDVMLVDCDFRKPALYKIFGMPKESVNNLLAALRAGGSVDNVVQRRKDSHLYTVFNRSAAAAKDIGSELDVLRELLRVCADKLQFVIVDTAPMSQVVETEELASLADASLLVVRRDAARTKSINDAIDALNQSGAPVLGSVFNDAPVGLAEKVRLYGYDARYEYGGYYGK